MKFCVVGAGIVGLCTVLEIQKQFPNADVTVIAEKFNKDTTSDGAAGLFLPFEHYLGPADDIKKKWIKDSYEYYANLMNKHENCGIYPLPGYVLSNCQHIYEYDIMNGVCNECRSVTEEELNQLNMKYKYGIFTDTLGIPSRKFLPWCLEKIKRNGGRIICKKIVSLESLENNYDVICNCTGLNARFLCNDTNVIPVRGQIVQVKAPWITHFYTFGSSYIIPSGYDGIVTLGGTADFASYDTEIDKNTSLSIIDKCARFLPKLRDAPVVKHWAGLRPYRTSVRVELEKRYSSVLIHNYGHGGCGITAAPGTSLNAVNLFRNFHLRGNGYYSKL